MKPPGGSPRVLHEAQGPRPLPAPVGHVVQLGLLRGSLSGTQLPKGPASPLAALLAQVAPRPCLSFPEALRVSCQSWCVAALHWGHRGPRNLPWTFSAEITGSTSDPERSCCQGDAHGA